MAALDWSKCPAVESIPGKVGGAWVFKGTRTPVSLVFENLEAGLTLREIVEMFPVSKDEISAVLEFAARSLAAPDAAAHTGEEVQLSPEMMEDIISQGYMNVN